MGLVGSLGAEGFDLETGMKYAHSWVWIGFLDDLLIKV